MTPRLSFRKQARAELLEACDWYDARSPGLGLEFMRVVEAALDLVLRMPQAFTPVRGDIRQVVLRRFPYTIRSRTRRMKSSCVTSNPGLKLARDLSHFGCPTRR